MSVQDFLAWLAAELNTALRVSIVDHARLDASRDLVLAAKDRLSGLSDADRRQVVNVLVRCLETGRIENYKLPVNGDTEDWLGGMIATLIDVLEE